MTLEFLEMTFADYPEATDLWRNCAGIGLSDADDPEPMRCFLERNPGLNFIAREDNQLVGTVLCGTDGRRGYLYHLAVRADQRRKGVGQKFVNRVLVALEGHGIHKCHIMVYGSNESGLLFWKQGGWVPRPEIVLMSHDIG
jgi:N-acetylglutamate synthase